jgi:uncharacterized repeat protein (TIGR02543 family)
LKEGEKMNKLKSRTLRPAALLCMGLLLLAGCEDPLHLEGPETTEDQQEMVTVIFDADGGSPETQTQKVTKGASVGSSNMPLEPARSGYTFDGWYASTGGSGSGFTSSTTVNGNIRVYAKWIPTVYIINYTLNEGTNAGENPGTYTIEILPVTLTAPTRPGYEFGGWYNNAGFSGAAVTGIPAGSTGNKNFYAKWEEPGTAYVITYHLNGGTNAGENPGTYTMESLPVTLTAPTRPGYDFDGWYNTAGFSGAAVTVIPAGSTGNKDFYAKWLPTVYIINYTLNGGTNAGENPGNYTIESPLITLTAPTRPDYDFNGWYNTAGFSGAAVTGIPAGSTGNKDFYAKWEEPGTAYVITYHLNGGTNAGGNPGNYTMESLPVTLTAPTRPGYEFGGWYNTADFSGSAVTGIPAGSTGNKDFYAKWTRSGTAVEIILQPVPDDPPLSSGVSLFENEQRQFSAAGDGYAAWAWYWNGKAIRGETSSTYTLAANSRDPGIYELTVVVTTGTGVRFSARCMITIKDYQGGTE